MAVLFELGNFPGEFVRIIETGKALFTGTHGPSDQQKLLVAVKQIAEVIKTLKHVTDEHHSWTTEHLPNAVSYGYVELPGEHLTLTRYTLLVQKLAELDAQYSAVAQSLSGALKAKDVQKILGALPALKEYAAKALEVSQDIDEKEGLMVKDGLNSHTNEVKEAVDLANKIEV